ncbi:hypothetical protein [Pseudomonas sp. OV226]|uniref:hypothetical protein n=1 Tax=Pseudomonas sp. OV226 TaxID=2135588 RepID=UPI000D6BC668|nr:hypothetical protein [Pseudomonas sp. OV226]PWK30899.1 hypothetical protein C7534_12559 [Pseudomonas sp. OV226]
MTDKMREEFEAAFVQHQVASHGEGFRSSAVHMLKRDGNFEKPPTYYELHRREQGMYDSFWVEIVWWAWQVSRESLVIELPPPYPVPEEPEEALDDSYMDAYHAANGMRHACSKFIEAAGLKVKP